MQQNLKKDIAVAQKVLSEEFGFKIDLVPGKGEGLSERSHVHRLEVTTRSAGLPASLILKQVRNKAEYDPDTLSGSAARLFDEWAGLQFLGQMCQEPLPAPRLYGGDRRAGFVLMEDFGTGTRLDHALLGEDAALAEKTLVALFATIGRMHAQSIGKQGQYDQLRRALGPMTAPFKASKKDLEGLGQHFARLGLEPHREFYTECETLLEMVNEPGPFHAYIHSDPCPDNCHWVGSDLRLLDFEGGRYAHALIDGVYPRIHFPTCWCVGRIPKKIMRKAEGAYRAQLVEGCPQAAEDHLFGAAVVGMCAYWAFAGSVNRLPRLLNDKAGGDFAPARRQLILRLEIMRAAAEEFGFFKALGEIAAAMGEKLRALWGDIGEMPFYPAFQGSAR